MDDKRKDVTREYVKKLSSRHDALSSLRNRFEGYSLPLHVISIQGKIGFLEWTLVDLLLSKFPSFMAKQSLIWKDGEFQCNPLHIAASAAMKAPQSTDTTVRMLALAPEAASVQDGSGLLPLSYAIHHKNTAAVELLTKAYPKGLFVKCYVMTDPIWYFFSDEYMIFNHGIRCKMFQSSIKGLLTGLSNNSLYSDMEMITSTVSESIFICDSSKAMFVFREIVNKFIEQYENGDNCNLCEMLLRLYCIVFPTSEVFYLEPYLKNMFGEYLGIRTFSMVVEYKSLNIIEEFKEV